MMNSLKEQALIVRVATIKEVAPTIKEFILTPEKGAALPAFSPGSHVVVTMKGEKTWRNPYSLLSDPLDTSHYRIAVRLQEVSRGGSVFMHNSVKEGDVLSIKPPMNLFAPHWQAKKHVLLAGGVGITPFMSFLPEMLRRQSNVALHYMFHSQTTGAYQEELKSLLGDKLFCYDSDKGNRCYVTQLMADQPLGTHFYVCGPDSLLAAVKASAEQLGWPQSAIHYETFAAPESGRSFIAELKSTGKQIQVAADVSLLDALEAESVDVPYSCRAGVCGRCFTKVVDGKIEHRDAFLSDKEKSQQNCLMPCVSRAASDVLILDL